MAAEPWRGELEAQQLLLTKQQSQIDAHGLKISALQKQLGCAPEDDAEVDLQLPNTTASSPRLSRCSSTTSHR